MCFFFIPMIRDDRVRGACCALSDGRVRASCCGGARSMLKSDTRERFFGGGEEEV